jgi:hypothetical protein
MRAMRPQGATTGARSAPTTETRFSRGHLILKGSPSPVDGCALDETAHKETRQRS